MNDIYRYRLIFYFEPKVLFLKDIALPSSGLVISQKNCIVALAQTLQMFNKTSSRSRNRRQNSTIVVDKRTRILLQSVITFSKVIGQRTLNDL